MIKQKTTQSSVFLFVATLLISYLLPLSSFVLHSQTAEELQAKIDSRNTDITNLQAEIKNYEKQIVDLDSKASSLSNTIKSLDLNRKKIETNIAIIEDKIATKNDEIKLISSKITVKEGSIADNQRSVRQTFINIQEIDDRSIPEILLSSQSLAGAWNSLEELSILEKGLQDNIVALGQAKAGLESDKKATQKAKADLLALNAQLTDQRAVVLSTVNDQKALLKATNRSESTYKNILASKKAQEAALQAEISNYEQSLHLLINPSQIPHTGSGILSWPLENIFITQYFGNTSFATANPQIYNGKGHTGVDFRASIGTPVKAALGGVVVGVANTDAIRGCYSYGRWIMVKHDNGLSTLYSHLSLQIVKVGESVNTGEVIGYSGNTGYSTGPHLHFGVYATQGVQIKLFTNSINCKGATIPIADYSAYLNPLSYL